MEKAVQKEKSEAASTPSSVQIRSFSPVDTDACYEICLRTADDGNDASMLHREARLPGEVWVGPYLVLYPEFAIVAEDAHGVGGYTVATPDSGAFDARSEAHWYPPLRRRYPPGDCAENARDAELVRLIHAPPRMPPEISDSHPAHLHIDLLPRLQGRGVGRRLMRELMRRMRGAGVASISLGCSATNTRAVAFYRHLGFTDLRDGVFWGRPTTPL